MASTNTENELRVFGAFAEEVEQCNLKIINCVILKIWYNPYGGIDLDTAMYQYMFWQTVNAETREFFAEL
ncbi:unnamed protein product [Mucor hiemalis]